MGGRMASLRWCVVWALLCGLSTWPIPSLCAAMPGIQLESVLMDWTRSLEEVDTTVCFRDGQVTDVSGASQYRLVLTTEEGGEWRQQGASRTADHQWCFPPVTQPKEHVSKTLSVLVTLKDLDLKTVLASGDAELFPIVPIVEAVRPDVWVISWKNPGADTFTLRREDHPHPLATGLTGQTCSYYLFLQEEDEGVFTIEMDDSSPVHQLARVVVNSSATDLSDLPHYTKVQILEIHQVLSGRDILGKDQNMVVVIVPEEDIEVLNWQVRQQHQDPNSGPTYTAIANQIYLKKETARIEFEGNLVESSFFFLLASDSSNTTIVFEIAAMNVTYLGTRVSWFQKDGVATGYLRIETGTLEKITAGNLTCQSTDSPCYLYSTGSQVPLEVPRCKDLMDTHNTVIIKHCDDVIGTPNSLTDAPMLVFYQEEKSLEVSYSDNATQVEVVVINPTDNTVFDNQFQCTGEDGHCRVDITDGLQSSQVTILVVLLDQDGYAVKSASVPFDVYNVSARQLLQDVVEVTWTYSISDTYHLAFTSDSSLESQVIVACTIAQNESCHGHLIRVDVAGKVSISVSQHMTENNIVVTNSISDVLPPEGQVNKVTRMVDSSSTRVTIATTKEPITQVTLAKFREDTANLSSLTEGYFVGDVKETAEGYSFEFTNDVLNQEKSVDLLCLGYKEDGSIGVAAAVYLTLTELKENLTWVGAEKSNPSASVRADTLLQEGSINGTRVCLQDTSPCYYLQVGGEEAWKVLRCEQVSNTAPGGSAMVSQCDDNLSAFKDTSLAPKVSMVDGSVEVTLSVSTTATIEVVVYDPANPNKVYSNTDVQCSTSDQEKKSCVQSMKVTKAGQQLSVLVVLVDQSTGSTVLESTLLSLQVPSPDGNSGTQAWVIVVSVLGSVFGAALIVFIAVVVYKKQQLRKVGGGGGSLQGSAHSTPMQKTAHDPYSAAHYSPQRSPPSRDSYSETNFSPRRDVHEPYNEARYSPGHSSHSSYQHAQSSVEPVVSYIPKASLKPHGTSSRFDSSPSSRHSDRGRY